MSTIPKNEPEVRRAKAKRYVAWCNKAVHEAPWVEGNTSSAGGGGIYVALELAEQAYEAHGLPYKVGLSHMSQYDPRRFTWVYDESGKKVGEYDDELIKTALEREKEREGQSFYLHNRVETIEDAARKLQELCPELRFCIAHGQMRERELEEKRMTLHERLRELDANLHVDASGDSRHE